MGGLLKAGIDILALLVSSSSGSVVAASVAVSVGPLAMLFLAAFCATTEVELVSSACAVALLFLGASLKALIVKSSYAAAALPALLLLVVASLFLPLPSKEPRTNPFYASLARAGTRFQRMMAAPVGGFGESGED